MAVTFFRYTAFLVCLAWVISCKTSQQLHLPKRKKTAFTGSAFIRQISAMGQKEREPIIIKEILDGNVPTFMKKIVAVKTAIWDSLANDSIRAIFFVLPDYLSIGSNKNFVRIPLTPMAAQLIADSLHCFLPTQKMTDLIYQQATVKLEPIPLTQYRDSVITFYQHHQLVEQQRNGKAGLIAGIKKDVIITAKLANLPGKVAIYGWHRLNGLPIQPVYTGHVNWYVDYSHGIRLVASVVLVNGKKYSYQEILQDKLLQKLLTDDDWSGFYRYGY